jgi:hypothetical protein
MTLPPLSSLSVDVFPSIVMRLFPSALSIIPAWSALVLLPLQLKNTMSPGR